MARGGNGVPPAPTGLYNVGGGGARSSVYYPGSTEDCADLMEGGNGGYPPPPAATPAPTPGAAGRGEAEVASPGPYPTFTPAMPGSPQPTASVPPSPGSPPPPSPSPVGSPSPAPASSLGPPPVLPPPTPIPDAAPGTVGAACDLSLSFQCADGLRCGQIDKFPGVCVPQTGSAAGSSCGSVGSVCEFGTVCADAETDVLCGELRMCPSGSGICRAAVAGDACDSERQVACGLDEDRLVCAPVTPPVSASTTDPPALVCVPTVPVGGACVAGGTDGCGIFSRSIQRVCVGGQCKSTFDAATADLGDECGGEVVCAGDARCESAFNGFTEPRCVNVATSVGASCDEAAFATCDSGAGLTCVSGACVDQTVGAGESCQPDSGPRCPAGTECVLTRFPPGRENERDTRCLVQRNIGERCDAPNDNCDAFAARCTDGVCVLTQDRGPGDPCGPADGGCAKGFACSAEGGGGVCQAAVGLGEPCTSEIQCIGSEAGPWACMAGPGAEGPTCRASARLGEPCVSAEVVCGELVLGGSGGLVCAVDGSGVCEVAPGTALAFRPCNDDAQCADGGEGWACLVEQLGDPSAPPTCRRRRREGETCSADGDLCEGEGLVCLTTSDTEPARCSRI
ncbi:hypothetical protein MMPV_007043 [Pyropia vietnamensis]